MIRAAGDSANGYKGVERAVVESRASLQPCGNVRLAR